MGGKHIFKCFKISNLVFKLSKIFLYSLTYSHKFKLIIKL